MTACLLPFCLFGQRLDVNLGIIRVAKSLKSLKILVCQSVGADGAEWGRRTGTGCKEL